MKLILFDLDDTLFDFATTFDVVLKKLFAAHPVISRYDADAFFETFQHYSNELYYLYEQRISTVEVYRNRRLIEALAAFQYTMTEEEASDFNQNYIREYVRSLQPDPAVQMLLNRLKERYQLGIITNGPHDMQEGKLERLGLMELFPSEQVWISNVVGLAKPDPQIYQLALDHFQVQAEETMFVGDSWEADVAGPIRVGMQAVWVNKYGKAPQTDVKPHAIISNIHELIDLL
ncbi:HAD family hydrolase [Paenibacillus aestuarii]|uniref:HAD family hydrolase n=1 Tax=Paenibacillus aestuarii TaxID=516965 RepID=A0ABW0KGW1_9BACL|nr:HAD family hydrolase [Paenibacillus aestuarii]